ncbi:MAG: hypothetical protein ACQEW9_06250 [Bacteroidota bacterium]
MEYIGAIPSSKSIHPTNIFHRIMELLCPFGNLGQFRLKYLLTSLIQSRITELEDIVDGFHKSKSAKMLRI